MRTEKQELITPQPSPPFVCHLREAYSQRKTEEKKKEKESQKAAKAAESAVQSKVETKGAVLYFKGANSDTTREKIKASESHSPLIKLIFVLVTCLPQEVMQEFATVAYIDFNKGDTEVI